MAHLTSQSSGECGSFLLWKSQHLSWQTRRGVFWSLQCHKQAASIHRSLPPIHSVLCEDGHSVNSLINYVNILIKQFSPFLLHSPCINFERTLSNVLPVSLTYVLPLERQTISLGQGRKDETKETAVQIHSFIHSLLPSSLHSFLPSFLSFFLPSFLPSLLPSYFPRSHHLSTEQSFRLIHLLQIHILQTIFILHKSTLSVTQTHTSSVQDTVYVTSTHEIP